MFWRRDTFPGAAALLVFQAGRTVFSCFRARLCQPCQIDMHPQIHIRPALAEEVPLLRMLIESSVRQLQAQDYTPEQIEGALTTVFGVDTQLVADGTYLVAEAEPDVSS